MNTRKINTSVNTTEESKNISTFQGCIAYKTQTLVNARDLHQFLVSRQEFSHWIKKRIKEYKFTQDIDFSVIDNFINDDSAFGGKRKIVEYHISLDMAKELSMVEKTDKGRQARHYFIAMEQQALNNHSHLVELNSRLKDGIFSHNLRYRQMYRYLQKDLNNDEIARCMQISTRMVRQLYREMMDLELLPSQEIFVLAHTGRISRIASPTQLGLEM